MPSIDGMMPRIPEGFAVECYKGDRLLETLFFKNRRALQKWVLENADITTVRIKIFSMAKRRYVEGKDVWT